ncbi:MAG: aminoacyl-tRNA hydrolase [Pseudomonadota bacterium]
MSQPIKLIAGLGNPGSKYIMTRHNAGFWFIDALANRLGSTFNVDKKFQAETFRYQHQSNDCWLCKPHTFMNESGTAIQSLQSYYKITPEETLIVHDEIDLPAGTIRFKSGGGHGGQNGLRDIIQKTGNNQFHRLRIGIGHPGSKDKVVSYVLSRPNSEEEEVMINSIAAIIDNYDLIFAGDMQGLMNQYNQK